MFDRVLNIPLLYFIIFLISYFVVINGVKIMIRPIGRGKTNR